MKLLYKTLPEGICIRRYYSLDGFARIPGQVEGRPVRELDRYAFSETVRGQEDLPGQWEDEPAVKGEGLTALALPQTLRRVGAYAFYNCSQLKSLSFFSTVEDWGAGVFTGCSGLGELDIQLMGGPRSCFKEVLSELRQTLTVSCRDSSGALAARLIFPEFFEESVENTPARILMREMHGCGHMYRYCFEGPEFSFGEYDRLFPHVQVQEKPELVTRLAVYRLYWPKGLIRDGEEAYWAYLKEHMRETVLGLIKRDELSILRWLTRSPRIDRADMEEMVLAAAASPDPRASALIMDARGQKLGAKGPRTQRTFIL